MNDNTNLLIVDNYIDQELIDQLLSEPIPNRPPGRHDWSIHNSLLDKVIWRASDDLKAFYGIEEPLYADYIALTASSVGMFHILHADAETLEGSPNHTAWRWVTAMIYLNTQGEDFEGGSIVFPRIDKEISPKAGQIVGFRCDGIHAHEVTPITSGVRRAVAVWFTPNERYYSRFAPKTKES